MTAILLLIAILPLRHRQPVRPWFLGAGILLGLVSATRPQLLHYPNLAWSRLGLALGRVMQPVIMTILFFAVFTPVGFMRRIFRNSPLCVFRDESRDSYWLPRIPPGPPPETMKNSF